MVNVDVSLTRLYVRRHNSGGIQHEGDEYTWRRVYTVVGKIYRPKVKDYMEVISWRGIAHGE